DGRRRERDLGWATPAPGAVIAAIRRGPVIAATLLLAAAVLPVVTRLPAQSTVEQRLRAQREELDRIRRERDSLERRMQDLKGQVHDLSDEVSTIGRQADATARLVRSLDAQLVSINSEVDSANLRLAAAERDLDAKKGSLHRRVVDIYKRGPLYTTEALLSAE